MRKRIATWMTLAVGLLAIVLPILAALYVAHRQTMDEETGRTSALAAELLVRADAMGKQAIEAHSLLRAAATDKPCSDAEVALMRDIGMKFNYLEAVGYVHDGRLLCSSFGRYRGGVALGPVAYVSALDAKVRPSVDLGLSNGHRFLVLQKDQFATAIHPATILDIFSGQHDVSFGLFGFSSGKLMAHHGVFDPAWPARLGKQRQITFFDGAYLVSAKRATGFDMVAYTAVPAAYLSSRLYALAKVLVPLGLLLGLGLSLAVFLLARQQNSLPATLRAALRNEEFSLHYQPVVALDSGRWVGLEALLRWPRNGTPGMRPSVFIPAAEDCGLIGKFTDYVLERVAADAPEFLARYPDCYISINLSPMDLHSSHVVDSLRRLVAQPDVAPGNIMVEVTEHSLLNAEVARPIIEQIRALGIRVAIDDFGTGFSNLSHLATLEIDFLKIDKLFVETGGNDSATSQVAVHIIDVARELEVGVIAEGVETRAQADFLRQHGVQYAQGWLFERAQPMDEILRHPA